MLIDAHMHIFAREWLNDGNRWAVAQRWAKSRVPYRDPREILPRIGETIHDPDGKQWARDREFLGIDISVNLPTDWGSAEGWNEEAELSIKEINRQHCLLAEKYPGKLYTFIGVNPRRSNALELLEMGVTEWGAKGLKLLPNLGFYPNDPVCYRLYEKCVKLGVPVTVHCGSGGFRYMKYTNPVHLDEPAKDFPELEFIMAHAGGGIGHLWAEAVSVAGANPNINLEFSENSVSVLKGGRRGSRGKYRDRTGQFIDMLDIMRNELAGGCANIIFGTDYPAVSLESAKGWVDLFKNLPAVAAEYGYDFSQEEVDLMCYQNAARIMKLDITKA